MLSGVVQVVTTAFPATVPKLGGGTTTPVAGDLLLEGTGGSCNVQMTALSDGSYALSSNGLSGTQFQINGAGPFFTSIADLSKVGIAVSGNIFVWLPGNSSVFNFTGIAQTQGPTVTSVTPTSAAPGAQMTITGTNLLDAMAVDFGATAGSAGTPGEIVSESATQITAIVPVISGASGAQNVSVSTWGGTSALGASDQFTYQAPGTPTISSISPTSAAAGTALTITGTFLFGAQAVNFQFLNASNQPTGAAGATVLSDAAGKIVVVVPPGTGNANVQVQTAVGTATEPFSYVAGSATPAPIVTSISAATTSGPTGTAVTINGLNLGSGPAFANVEFNGVPAFVQSDTGTQIVAISPPGVGTAFVSVTTAGGSTEQGATFENNLGLGSFSGADAFAFTSVNPTPSTDIPADLNVIDATATIINAGVGGDLNIYTDGTAGPYTATLMDSVVLGDTNVESSAATTIMYADFSGDLTIDNTTTSVSVSYAEIDGDLTVKSKAVAAPETVSLSYLWMEGGTATVDTSAATGGGTATSMTHTAFNDPFSPDLTIDYGPGFNTLTIGAGTFIFGDPTATAVKITDGAGGSDSVLGQGPLAGLTIDGGVTIANASNVSSSGETNTVEFNNADVWGGVGITNAGGDNVIHVVASQLGCGPDLTAGGPVTVKNDQSSEPGTNYFSADAGSAFPLGLYIDNEVLAAPPPGAFSNSTILDQAYVGRTQAGAVPFAAAALPTFVTTEKGNTDDTFFVHDDSPDDVVVVRNNSVVVGMAELQLLGNAPNIGFDSSTVTGLLINAPATGLGGAGPGATVWLGGVTVQAELSITLGGGDSKLYVQPGSTNTSAFDSFPGSATLSFAAGDQLIYDTNDQEVLDLFGISGPPNPSLEFVQASSPSNTNLNFVTNIYPTS
jgi:hypothetical protein